MSDNKGNTMEEYCDVNGKKISLDLLVVKEPGWASNIIRFYKNRLNDNKAELTAANESRARLLESILQTVRNLQDKSDAFIGDRTDYVTTANSQGFKEGLGWAVISIGRAIDNANECDEAIEQEGSK